VRTWTPQALWASADDANATLRSAADADTPNWIRKLHISDERMPRHLRISSDSFNLVRDISSMSAVTYFPYAYWWRQLVMWHRPRISRVWCDPARGFNFHPCSVATTLLFELVSLILMLLVICEMETSRLLCACVSQVISMKISYTMT